MRPLRACTRPNEAILPHGSKVLPQIHRDPVRQGPRPCRARKRKCRRGAPEKMACLLGHLAVPRGRLLILQVSGVPSLLFHSFTTNSVPILLCLSSTISLSIYNISLASHGPVTIWRWSNFNPPLLPILPSLNISMLVPNPKSGSILCDRLLLSAMAKVHRGILHYFTPPLSFSFQRR